MRPSRSISSTMASAIEAPQSGSRIALSIMVTGDISRTGVQTQPETPTRSRAGFSRQSRPCPPRSAASGCPANERRRLSGGVFFCSANGQAFRTISMTSEGSRFGLHQRRTGSLSPNNRPDGALAAASCNWPCVDRVTAPVPCLISLVIWLTARRGLPYI